MIVVREKAQAGSPSTHLTQASWIVFISTEKDFGCFPLIFSILFGLMKVEDGENIADRGSARRHTPRTELER